MLFLKICSSAFRLCISFCACLDIPAQFAVARSRFVSFALANINKALVHFGHPTAHYVPAKNHIFVSDCFLAPDLWLAPLQLKALADEMLHLLFLFLVCSCKSSFCIRSFFSAFALSLFTCSFFHPHTIWQSQNHFLPLS